MNVQTADRRVLIIDDEKDFAESLADILESRDFSVSVVHSSADALQSLSEFNPHCVLLDIRLGLEDGIDLLAKLKGVRPELLCVMMTAYANTDSAIEALQIGAYDYLRKPLEARDLLATMDRCFENVRLIEERDAAYEALKIRNEELGEINARLRQMVDSARELASCRDVEELGRHLLSDFASLMAAEGGSLYMLHEEGLKLIASLGDGSAPGLLELPLPVGSVCDLVMRDRKPILVRDITKEKIFPSGSSYKDGSLFALPILDHDGDVLAIVSLHNKMWPPFTPQDRDVGQVMLSLAGEILRSQQATEKIRISLQEKDVLLKEVHHRVKNNLQVISGLLNLQAHHVKDEESRRIYQDSQNRVSTMALIHEQLYQVDDLANVHFAGFVQELTTNLMRSYSMSDSRIELELDVQDVEMVIDTAIPCGLIINELFANSLQYAFPDGREGRIRMEFSEPEEGHYKLIFSDDGVGFPDGFDFESTKTMGLQLVRILSEQLNSETVVQSGPGTSFTFNFREYLEAGSVLY